MEKWEKKVNCKVNKAAFGDLIATKKMETGSDRKCGSSMRENGCIQWKKTAMVEIWKWAVKENVTSYERKWVQAME